MDATDLINQFYEFVELNYLNKLLEIINSGKTSLNISFSKLCKYNPQMADELLDQPEETIKAFEAALMRFNVGENIKKTSVRIMGISKTQHLLINQIRSKHIGKLLCFEGTVRMKSNVRPRITAARYECPGCGNVISVLQLEPELKEPTKCGCGRKGKFRMINKEMVDGFSITLEEPTEVISGGSELKKLNVFFRGDLTDEKLENRVYQGAKLKVTGYLMEVMKRSQKGTSTELDFYLEANYVELLDKEYSDIKVTEEDKETFRNISQSEDPVHWIANSVFYRLEGYDKIKEAVALQMAGGVLKNVDGQSVRGDIHILLIGDPGCLPRGTLVKTPEGNIPIERCNTVWSYDHHGKRIQQPAFVINSGNKEVYNISINDRKIRCSGEHKWFVIRNGSIRDVQTKDLNNQDYLLMEYDSQKMSCLSKGVQDIQSEILFSKMLLGDSIIKTEREGQSILSDSRPSKDKRDVSSGKTICIGDRKETEHRSPCDNAKIKNNGNPIEEFQRTCEKWDKSKHPEISKSIQWNKEFFVQAWELYWSKNKLQGIQEIGKEVYALDVSDMFTEQYKIRSVCAPYKQEQQGQQGGKSDGIMQVVPLKITCISKEQELEEMFDLIVPTTNNFILSNGIISHNSGKSQFLKIGKTCVPKGRFSSGKGSSGTGLTAAVIKNDLLGGWACEAGLLPLCNGGMAFLDEFDKMSDEDRSSLHEALEEQTVSINKANIQATLICKVAVLAAANPKFGRFDMAADIYAQVNLTPTLVNRFDLIFTFQDKPDEDKDNKIATTILAAATERGVTKSEDILDRDTIRKYLAYAKSFSPKLSESAYERLREFYIKIRNGDRKTDSNGDIPISARQLQSLVRFTEASAKLRLSNVASVEDADRAIDLIYYFLKQFAFNEETGKLNIDEITIGSSVKKKQGEIINDIVYRLTSSSSDGIVSTEDLIVSLKKEGISEFKAEEYISKLITKGDLFEPRRGYLKRI